MSDAPARKNWRLAPQDPDRGQQLAAELKIHPAVGQLLLNRGVASVEAGRRFLDRRLTQLADPHELAGVSKAAELIFDVGRRGLKIAVYADYDVDGMCAAAILSECLTIAGIKNSCYVPDRLEEGYGVNEAALVKLKEDGVDLVVTVDCGVASLQEAEAARRLGLQYIVTDHHEPKSSWPVADAIVHPKYPGSSPISAGLCGAGVAYKLAWEIARLASGGPRTSEAFRTFLLDATALAAIATVCDVAPLTGENRVLVHHGLAALSRQPSLGLQALIQQAGLAEGKRISVGDVGFTLGPRLNASGRLGTARLGIELLTTRDIGRAGKIAEYLDETNKQRQLLERRMFIRARELAEERYRFSEGEDVSAIVLSDEYAADRWHPGVLGIVASRMVERYHRPCILLAATGDQLSGSGRSVPGFNLHVAVEQCADTLIGSGGHAMAVGVRCESRRFEDFRAQFEAAVGEQMPPASRVGEIRIDAEVSLPMLTMDLLKGIETLEPFGLGNPSPLFFAGNLQLAGEPRKVGAGERHLSFSVRPKSADAPVRKAIGFDMGDRIEELTSQQGACCLAFTPLPNEFAGRVSVDLRLRDFRAGPKFPSPQPS